MRGILRRRYMPRRFAMSPLLIYIHGFKSSPQSQKAQEVQAFLNSNHYAVDFQAPALSNYPAEAFQQLTELLLSAQQQGREKITLIGSSLGGFMATALSQQHALKAVLINPAVYPHRLIEQFLGDNLNPYTDEVFTLTEQHLQELKQLHCETIIAPERLWVLLQTGDETLDYRHALNYYQGCRQTVETGGDHRFQHFDRHLPTIMQFLELDSARS